METYTGYCIKCKANKVIADAVDSEFKNGTPIKTGKCETCGSKLNRIMARERP